MKKTRKTGFTLVELLVVIAIIALLLAVIIPALSRAKDIAKRTLCGNQVKQIGIGMNVYVGEYDNLMPWYGGYDPFYPAPWTGTTKDESTIHPYVGYRTNHSNNDAGYQDTTRPCNGIINNAACPSMGRAYAARLACLFEKGMIKDARVFYCPGNPKSAPDYLYESYISPMPWGTAHQVYNLTANPVKNDWIRTGYTYYPIDGFFDALTTPVIQPSPYNPNPSTGNYNTVQGKNVPRYTARRYDKLSRCYPYLTDVLEKRKDLSHKSGIDKATNHVTNAGINAVFKDGHVIYFKDQPVKVGAQTQKFFDNDYWTNWDRPASQPPSDEDDRRYILFNLFRMVSP